MNSARLLILFVVAIASISNALAVFGVGEPPISLLVRPSAIGAGYVLVITNTSDDHLHEISVQAKTPNGEILKKRVVATTLAPHKSIEIGWLELSDWQFAAGETVYIGAKGYWSYVSGKIKG